MIWLIPYALIGLSLRGGYSDYYGVSSSQVIRDLDIVHIGNEIAIVNSKFISIMGGAVYFETNNPVALLVEECLFSNCSSITAGALIYKCLYGAHVMSRVCAHSCYTETSGSNQFSYVQVGNNKENYMNLSTITQCAPSHLTNRNWGQGFVNGRQIISFSNSSYNYGVIGAGLYIETSNSIDFRFCTLADCQATSHIIIQRTGTTTNCNFSYCNFIRNSTPSYVLYFANHANVYDCFFMQNSIILIYVYGTNVYVNLIRGWLFHSYTLLTITANYRGYLSYNNITNTNVATPSHNIAHLSTQQCYIEIDQQFIVHPSPTECFLSSNDPGVLLSKIFSLNVINNLVSFSVFLSATL